MSQTAPEKKTTIKTTVLNVIIVCISILLSIIAAEGILRFKNRSMKNYDIEMWKYSKELKVRSDNPLLGHEHVRPSKAILQSVEIRINERGLRGGPVGKKEKSKRRILFLGSSITLGWGVNEKDTLTVRLENMFKADGDDVEVLNSGIGNYNTVRYVERFMTMLSDLDPTDIVVHYFINDAETLKRGGGNFILRNSQFAVILWSFIQSKTAVAKTGGLEGHYKAVYDHEAKGYTEMKKSLKRLSEYAKEKGINVYIAMMPDIHNLKDYKFAYIHEELEKIANEFGYIYVDLFPAFKGLTPEDVWSMPGDPHPNELGHEIIAKTLYPVLKKQKYNEGI